MCLCFLFFWLKNRFDSNIQIIWWWWWGLKKQNPLENGKNSFPWMFSFSFIPGTYQIIRIFFILATNDFVTNNNNNNECQVSIFNHSICYRFETKHEQQQQQNFSGWKTENKKLIINSLASCIIVFLLVFFDIFNNQNMKNGIEKSESSK